MTRLYDGKDKERFIVIIIYNEEFVLNVTIVKEILGILDVVLKQ